MTKLELTIIQIVLIMAAITNSWLLSCYSMDFSSKNKLKTELESICTVYKNPCRIVYKETNLIQGFTTPKGDIVLTDGLLNLLSYNQVRAVGLHELGHHILQHYKKQDKFLKNWDLDTKKLIKFRYSNEVEADLFATKYALSSNETNYLPSALTTLTNPTAINTNTVTHPSTATRINTINIYTNYYNQTQPILTRPYLLPKAQNNYSWELIY